MSEHAIRAPGTRGGDGFAGKVAVLIDQVRRYGAEKDTIRAEAEGYEGSSARWNGLSEQELRR